MGIRKIITNEDHLHNLSSLILFEMSPRDQNTALFQTTGYSLRYFKILHCACVNVLFLKLFIVAFKVVELLQSKLVPVIACVNFIFLRYDLKTLKHEILH